MRGRLNILVSGGTGAGKTTTLNVLSSFIPDDERIVTIEDAAELRLHQDHVLRLESRPPNIEGKGEVTIRDLVRNSLRMRPDRIVVGEIRDAAALDMLQAMNTGHDGSISTLHANTPRDALSRLETMVLMAGMDLPVRAIREQVASAVDLIIQQTRLKDGTRRITHITEVVGMEGDIITLQDVFLFDYGAGFDENGRFQGGLKSTGLRPRFLERLADHGVHVDPAIFATRRAAAMSARGLARAAGVARGAPRRRCSLASDRRRTPRTRSPSTTSRPRTASVSMVLVGRRVPGGRRSTPTAVTVEVDGRAVDATAKTVAAGDIERIDRPGARRQQQHGKGGKFDGGHQAAVDAFLDAAPERRRASAWSPSPATSTRPSSPPPTTTAVRTRSRALSSAKGTSVYDGVAAGRRARRAPTARAPCWCSPTAPTPAARPPSRSSSSDAQDAGVVVDVVSLASQRTRATTLAGLADDTGGRSSRPTRRPSAPSSPPRPTPRHSSCSSPSTVAEDVSGDASIGVTVDAGGDDLHRLRLRHARRPARRRAPTSVESGKAAGRHARHAAGRASPSRSAWLASSAIGRSAGATDADQRRSQRLDAYFDAGTAAGAKPARTAAERRPTFKDSAVALTDRVVKRRPRDAHLPAAGGRRVRADARPSGCCCTPAIAVGAAVVGFVLAAAAMAVLGLVLGVVCPWFYLQFAAPPRLSAFNGQLAETLGSDGRRPPGRAVAAAGGRHRRPRGQRADGRRAPARARRAAARESTSRTPSRASASGWRATTSAGS